MDEFEKNVIATRLPCLHIFHGHCILRMLETDHKCPLCRYKMPHGDDGIEPKSNGVVIYQHSNHVKIEWRQPCTRSLSSDALHIQFNLYQSNLEGQVELDGEVRLFMHTHKFQLKTKPQLLTIPNLELQPILITQVLKTMCVPRYEQRPIVAKIIEAVANNNIDDHAPLAFINVDIYDESLKLFDRSGWLQWHKQIMMESEDGLDSEGFQRYKPRPKPASQSVIEELERVRMDRSCGICMEDFEDGLIATRFPCLHIFHRHCILSWLDIHHRCPLCQYPLPQNLKHGFAVRVACTSCRHISND